jgi:hypothetical protein
LAPVSEVSAHGQLTHCFSAYDKAEHHDGEHMVEQSSSLPWVGRKKERGRGFKGTAPVAHFNYSSSHNLPVAH